jgi:hypothetical protein
MTHPDGTLEQIDLLTNQTTRLPGMVSSAYAVPDGWMVIQPSGQQNVLSKIDTLGVATILTYHPPRE